MNVQFEDWAEFYSNGGRFYQWTRGVSKRKWRLFGIACLRHVWDDLEHEITREAVEVFERFVDRTASESDLRSVWLEAHLDTQNYLWIGEDAQWESMEYGFYEEDELYGETETAPNWLREGVKEALSESLATAERHAKHALELVSWTFEGLERERKLEAGRKAQWRFFQDIIGGGARYELPKGEWRTWNNGTLEAMARSIYESRRFDEMPILADALEDAGCPSKMILDHCRADVTHVRGCWVLDKLLGHQ